MKNASVPWHSCIFERCSLLLLSAQRSERISILTVMASALPVLTPVSGSRQYDIRILGQDKEQWMKHQMLRIICRQRAAVRSLSIPSAVYHSCADEMDSAADNCGVYIACTFRQLAKRAVFPQRQDLIGIGIGIVI